MQRSIHRSLLLGCLAVVLALGSTLVAHAAVINATNLLGQVDVNGSPVWTKSVANNSPAAPNALGFGGPDGVAIDTVNGRLFVSDQFNNRVLVFSITASDSLVSSTASLVLGQTNFTTSTAATTQSGLNGPAGLFYDSTSNLLFVADALNNRVMAFSVPANATSGVNGENATFILGQTNFTSSTRTTTQSGLARPAGVFYDSANARLFVNDTRNNRVMAFSVPANATSGINGELATFELGQADFTSSSTATTQSGLNNGTTAQAGIVYDSINARLFVNDALNNRVMAFSVPANATSGVNGEPATFVLGQPNFTSSSTATTQSGLNNTANPSTYQPAVVYDSANARLFAIDYGNNRVMAFSVPANATSGINGENATFVLGQTNFTTSTAATTQSGLSRPVNGIYDPTNSILFISDFSNNRVMAFSVPANATSGINGENATSAIGHYDASGAISFVNGVGADGSLINAQGFDMTHSQALDTVNHRLFVSDTTVNNRILVFPLDSDNNITTTTPQYVLGPCNFTTVGANTASSSTFGSSNVAYDNVNSRLFVSDVTNVRVLAFNVATSTITDCEAATFVLGQTNFTGTGSVFGQSGFFGNDDVAYDPVNFRLFVSDTSANRVMAFSVPANATSGINGEPATFELGQADFSSGVGSIAQNRLNKSAGISYDPVNARLFVSDNANNRVMAFSVPANATSGINGENATFELGQTDFASKVATTTQSGLNSPDDNGWDSTGNRLFVSDTQNRRIMIFNIPNNATSGFNGANAQANLSQTSWTSSVSGFAQNVFNTPEPDQSYDPINNLLYFHDSSGFRVLQMNFIHITTASFPSSTVNVAYSQPLAVTSTQGTSQVYSVYSGSLPSGLSLSSSTGIISGIPTVVTSTSATIEADDDFSDGSVFFDRAAFTIQTNDAALSGITPSTPPSGIYNVAYFQILTATGGSAPYTWSIASGTLPSGLSLATSSTNSTTTISGIPTVIATSSFTIEVQSSGGATTTATYAFTVSPVAPISVSVAAGGGGGGGNNYGIGGTMTSTSTAPIASSTPSTSSSTTTTVVTTTQTTASLEAELVSLEAQLSALEVQAGETGIAPASSSSSCTPAPITATNDASYPFTRDLSYNDQGVDVSALQQFLIDQNSGPVARSLAEVGATGLFINHTLLALKEFQASACINPTGYFGSITRAYLKY